MIKLDIQNSHLVSRSDNLEVSLRFNEFESQVSTERKTLQLRMLLQPNSTSTQVAKAGTVVTTAALSTASFMQMIFVGSLAQVWGMINGLQIIVHCPTFALEFPPAILEVVKSLLQVATFDLPMVNIDTLTGHHFPVGN